MSFINKLANGNLLDNLTINNRLNVGDVVNTKNIVISEKITLHQDAEIEGYFLKTFSEPLDEDTNEEIDLYEKIARIDTKISTNTLQNGNNAAAISTRYTKGQADTLFAKSTDPYITGSINIRDDMSTPFETLDSILSTKVDDSQLGNYVSLEDSDTALALKADLSVLTNDYVTKDEPEFNLTENDRLNEEKNPLENIKINKTFETTTDGNPTSLISETNMKLVLDDRYKLITESEAEIEEIQNNKADVIDTVFKVSQNYQSDLMQFMLYNENYEVTDTISLKGLLAEKANLELIYTKEQVDSMLTDPEFETTDDNLLTFSGSQNTTLKALLAEKTTIEDVEQAITALDLPAKNNPEFTGVLKINNVNVESKIDSKLNATDPTIDATSDDLIMFTGVNNTSLKTLLEGKLNAGALANTVVTTNTLSDPVIVGSLNYKETSLDTDSRNLISEISNKANLNAPNFQTSLQLNSTNVLLQPADFNGSLQSYIELKAPESDLSGLVSKPADYADNSLESYIQLKASETEASYLVSKPADYGDGDLKSYIQTVGISGGARFDDSVIKIRLKNIDGQDDKIWEYTHPAGTYSAIDSIQTLERLVGIIPTMLDIYGYTIVENNSIYNLDRFNPNFIVAKQGNLEFEVEISYALRFQLLLGLPAIMTSTSSNITPTEMRISLDYDLSTLIPEYPLFSDRTERGLLRAITKPSDFTDTEDLSTYIEKKCLPKVITKRLRIGRQATYDKFFTISTSDDISSFTIKRVRLSKFYEYTHGNVYGATPPVDMEPDNYTIVPLWTPETSVTNDDLTADLFNNDTTTKYKFNKPTSDIQMIGYTRPALFEIRFIDDNDVLTDVAGLVNVIVVEFEETEPFPKNILVTNLDERKNRKFYNFTGANQYYVLPSVVFDVISAKNYHGIKTNMVEDLDDQLADVADVTSKGYELINQTFRVESSYEYSPGNFETNYGNYTFVNGTYTANYIIQAIGSYTKTLMNQICSNKGYIILEEDIEINLERFKIGLTLDKTTHIGFEIKLNDCPTLMEIFGLPATTETVTVVVGSVLRIEFMDNGEFGLNLSENSYPKIDDHISRRLISMQLRMDQLEQAIDPAYRFLAFYGEALNQADSKPTFQELELDLKDGRQIGWGSMEGIQPPVQTFAWDYWSGNDNLSDVFDGLKAYGDSPRLQFLFENYGYNDRKRVIFYFDCTTKKRVKSGTYWTYPDTINSFDNGRIYGTNRPPPLLNDPSHIYEWEYVCDLRKIGMG